MDWRIRLMSLNPKIATAELWRHDELVSRLRREGAT